MYNNKEIQRKSKKEKKNQPQDISKIKKNGINQQLLIDSTQTLISSETKLNVKHIINYKNK
jgi:hypothetical protein